jgi:virulence-associated protein VapD
MYTHDGSRVLCAEDGDGSWIQSDDVRKMLEVIQYNLIQGNVGLNEDFVSNHLDTFCSNEVGPSNG